MRGRTRPRTRNFVLIEADYQHPVKRFVRWTNQILSAGVLLLLHLAFTGFKVAFRA